MLRAWVDRRFPAEFENLTFSQTPGKLVGQRLDRYTVLLHGVAVPNCDCPVINCVEVDSDTERCADLVLATIPSANALRVVVLDEARNTPRAPYSLEHLTSSWRQTLVPGEWQNGHFDWSYLGMQLQERAGSLICLRPT